MPTSEIFYLKQNTATTVKLFTHSSSNNALFAGSPDSSAGSSPISNIWGGSYTAYNIPGTVSITPYKGTTTTKSVPAITSSLPQATSYDRVVKGFIAAGSASAVGLPASIAFVDFSSIDGQIITTTAAITTANPATSIPSGTKVRIAGNNYSGSSYSEASSCYDASVSFYFAAKFDISTWILVGWDVFTLVPNTTNDGNRVIEVSLTAGDTATLGPLKINWRIAGSNSITTSYQTPYTISTPIYGTQQVITGYSTSTVYRISPGSLTWADWRYASLGPPVYSLPYGTYTYNTQSEASAYHGYSMYRITSTRGLAEDGTLEYCIYTYNTVTGPYTISTPIYGTQQIITGYSYSTGYTTNYTTTNWSWNYTAIPTQFYVTPDGLPPAPPFKMHI
jgi:hypothetical protein